MAIGEVKWFNNQKGYGFIKPDDGPSDIFVHVTAVRSSGLQTLREGQRVEFELHQQADGRTSAQDLKLVDGEAEAE